MAILSLQRRLAEVGRIRLGQQVETRSGKKRPAALTTFRLTSGDRARIEQAAKLYGGVVTKWEAPNGLPAWEVITQADKLPVIVPPSQMAFSQYYELWSAGGCQRRCDGVTETLSEQPCICEANENRQCEIHTRLSVMLSEMSGLGVWRVDTQGYYAALELQGAVEVIAMAAGKGQMLPATLRLDPRSIKREGEGKKNFVVPVLDIDVSPAQLMMGTISSTVDTGQVAQTPERKALTPVPDAGERPSIAEQVQASADKPSSRRATPIPSTGITPRTAAQAHSEPEQGHRDPWDAAEHDQRQSAANDDQPPPSDDPWKAIDAAQEAEEAAREAAQDTQDQPRMVTKPQLTKLGILLGKQGFDKTAEGKAARMDFCTELLKELVRLGKMTQRPWTGRKLKSSTDLTFEEAHHLIDFLEQDEKREQEQAQQEPSPAADQPTEELPANTTISDVNNQKDETLSQSSNEADSEANDNGGFQLEPTDAPNPEPENPVEDEPPADDDRSPGPGQLDLLGR